MLDADISASEKSTSRLAAETFSLVGAGGETTGSTLSLLVFHLATNPAKLARLRAELKPLFAASHKPTWTQLEAVPYLAAVVKEGLRLNQGVISRLPRCAPDRNTFYKDIMLPRGTCVSMSVQDIHEHPDLFPDAKEFIPERWLSEAVSGEGAPTSKLDRWLVPFSRGTRHCLGMK